MTTNKITPEELWARQQISPLDVDYNLWNERRAPMERIKRTVINRKTGEILASAVVPADQQLTKREKEDGDWIFYVKKTNEIVFVSKNPYIRTYFKPSLGIQYYYRQ